MISVNSLYTGTRPLIQPIFRSAQNFLILEGYLLNKLKFAAMTFISHLFIYIQVFALSILHPLHVTVTEIEFDQKDKALEIIMRVFVDDFELTLREDLKQPELDIIEPKNGLTTDQMSQAYIEKHFRITLDNKVQKIKYLGHETEGEAFLFYIEVPNVKKWKTISVFNDMITEMHEDQSNLVHVTVNGKVKSLRLTRNTPAEKLSFESK